MKTNFANRYVAKYVSTYSITSLFFTSRCVKKERKQQLQAHPHSRMVDWKISIMLLLERRPIRVCSFLFD